MKLLRLLRRSFILSIFILFAAHSASASVELDFNYYAVPSSARVYQCPDGKLASAGYSLCGTEAELAWYFYRNKIDSFQAGVNASFGNQIFKIVNLSLTDFRLTFSAELTASLGPAVRFTLAPGHSLMLNPALQFNAGFLWDNIKNLYGMIDLSAQLNIGYKWWFLNTEYVRVGLNLQTGYGIPMTGVFKGLEIKSNGIIFQDSTKLLKGHDFKIYLGIALDIGRAV